MKQSNWKVYKKIKIKGGCTMDFFYDVIDKVSELFGKRTDRETEQPVYGGRIDEGPMVTSYKPVNETVRYEKIERNEKQNRNDRNSNTDRNQQQAEVQNQVLMQKVINGRVFNLQQAAAMIDKVKENYVHVINLEDVDEALMQPIIDFIYGAVYALYGTIKNVGRYIFIIAPQGVEITNEILAAGTDPSKYRRTRSY
jgi:cell division inhibitor SepF